MTPVVIENPIIKMKDEMVKDFLLII
ncbi:hypothetical protein LCGC14_2517410, partial [marine sediment metagenome]